MDVRLYFQSAVDFLIGLGMLHDEATLTLSMIVILPVIGFFVWFAAKYDNWFSEAAVSQENIAESSRRSTPKRNLYPELNWTQRLVHRQRMSEAEKDREGQGVFWVTVFLILLFGSFASFGAIVAGKPQKIPEAFFYAFVMWSVVMGVIWMGVDFSRDVAHTVEDVVFETGDGGVVTQFGRAWIEPSRDGLHLEFRYEVKQAGKYPAYHGRFRYADLSGFSVESESGWISGQRFDSRRALDSSLIVAGIGETDSEWVVRSTDGMGDVARLRQQFEDTFIAPRNHILAQFNAKRHREFEDFD